MLKIRLQGTKDRFKNAEGEIKLVKDATLEEREKNSYWTI